MKDKNAINFYKLQYDLILLFISFLKMTNLYYFLHYLLSPLDK